jgi:hypothetical protein
MMFVRVRLVLGSVIGATLVILAVCLGAQNLDDRPSLRLGVGRAAPLPTGFLLGVALAAGLFSGGAAVAVLAGDEEAPEETRDSEGRY